jgi:hypothetical protein
MSNDVSLDKSSDVSLDKSSDVSSDVSLDKSSDQKKKKKICFVSSLYGYDIKKCDLPGKFDRNPNYDYLLITNFDSKEFETSWDVIKLDFTKEKFRLDLGLGLGFGLDLELGYSKGGYILRSRYPKFMMWKIFQDYPDKFRDYIWQDYEMLVYCDAFLSPKLDVDWIDILNRLRIPENNLMNYLCQSSKNIVRKRGGSVNNNIVRVLQDLHQNKEVREGGIKKEMELIVSSQKDSSDNILSSIELMSKILGNKSTIIKQGRYCLNTCFAYDMKCKNTRKFLESFWKMYNLNGRKKAAKITYRDQPWWNFWLIYQNKFTLVYKDEIEYEKKKEQEQKQKQKQKQEKENNLFFMNNFEISGKFRGHNYLYY